MNRLRGSLDRDRARQIGELLEASKVDSGAKFWKGYRDASRELGLMIRTNGLPLALALAIDWAKLEDQDFQKVEPSSDRSGRARALIDLTTLLLPEKTPNDAQSLRSMVMSLTTLDRAHYNGAIDQALGALLWQKTLSAPLAPRDKPGESE